VDTGDRNGLADSLACLPDAVEDHDRAGVHERCL
jgi:hypothetical protein